MNSGIVKKIQIEIVKNAPTILTVMGGIGVLASVALSSDSALRVKMDLEAEEDDISTADRVLIYARAYAPTAIMTTATLTCIFGANHLNRRRIAGLAGAYIASETAFGEYKEKVEELFGGKKADKVAEEIIQEHVKKNPQTPENTVHPMNYTVDSGLSLWFDEVAQRYFYSSAEKIRRAEIDATSILRETGFVSVNDIYQMLGLPVIKGLDECGWEYNLSDPYSSKNRDVRIIIGGALTDNGVPCGTIDMDPHPNSSWFIE